MKCIVALPFAVALLTVGAGAAAEPSPPYPSPGASRAHLATPVAQPVEKLIDGRFWSCAADTCAAGRQDGSDSQPLWMECAHAAAEFGAFTDYRTGAAVLDAAKLARCDAHAKGQARG